ncbi:MAG TPA: hypothetical protein DCW72_07055, partial [Elusimicrobia bacterium]|nr:hypothetical protein [Elusimicrobiota bacterium]
CDSSGCRDRSPARLISLMEEFSPSITWNFFQAGISRRVLKYICWALALVSCIKKGERFF